ncbi:UNVERIFIED_ORG: NAD(P)-dependent dehydrogenase (short-subunit alcohol dehydrogenase family) [Nocardia globerula]|uniref:NAD(P)-dependent dehydrogenase (Short-subunit alcohol dehydrogenase family) n=1 Tax=Nocardia globerula TaxID=1818 RepID=A0A652YSQ5_NOCGL|nr:SDR family NAD(P)-dependent oxidoreductase [Rhodococcus globerulus]NMD61329.1 SDR family NAD(P)-dependent oxidoreductase [Nocardia globerula]PVX67119.1 NAD(P)-dependent dehydrogenase (short-subunit alcohol dehydrogenase family) [Rhodococcus globerulus]
MDISTASALVTGGAGGLGEATVRQLVGAGTAVVIADLNDERGKALEVELGDKVRYVNTDVLDEASVNAAIAVAQELAPLRIVVNAHGGGAGASRVVGRDGEPASFEQFQWYVNLFLNGTFNVLRLGAAAMARNEADPSSGRGVIVNTASIAAFEGQIGQTAYSAAKGGVVGLTLPAARDLTKLGIRVMAIAPGTFFTPAFKMERDEAEKHWGSTVPFPNRMGSPSEYAALVQHIAENDYLNGEVIRIDGALRFQPK